MQSLSFSAPSRRLNMATPHFKVLTVLASLCVASFAFTSVNDCPKFKEDGDDVIIKICENTCYYFHVKEVNTFTGASAVCGGRGATLVMPRSKDISDFVNEELESFNADEQGMELTDKTWVGLMQQQSDSDDPVFFWLNGEKVDPKYAQSILKYGEAHTIKRKKGIWQFESSNKDVKNNFVCEIPGTDTTLAPTLKTTTAMKKPRKVEFVCPKISNDVAHMKLFEDSCFYFNVKSKKSYEDASEFCKSFGGTLATIKTKNVDTFLRAILRKVFKITDALWIGLHSEGDGELPSSWDDGSPVSFRNFQYSFAIWDYYTMSAKEKWEAFPDAMRQYFICQFSATF